MPRRYNNIPTLISPTSKRYIQEVKYPEVDLSVNDVYVITTSGDRFDLLADQYYNDSSLWWIISIANTDLPQGSLFIPEGTQLRIPANFVDIVSKFKFINNG